MNDIETEYNIIVDTAANDRMYDHFEFLARVNINAADNLLDCLSQSMSSLKNSPHRNPVYDRPYLPKGKYRYLISCDRYRIVYQIIENCVYIDDIQDCRQSDINNLL